MSIDARICRVNYSNGEVVLDLKDRTTDDPAGQPFLYIVNPSYGLEALRGEEIWGGSDSIMLGDFKIAERIGYSRIRMMPNWMDALVKRERTVQ